MKRLATVRGCHSLLQHFYCMCVYYVGCFTRFTDSSCSLSPMPASLRLAQHPLAFSAWTLSIGHQEELPACIKLTDEMLAWFSVWNEGQVICHCQPIICCLVKIQNGSVFLMRPVYPDCCGKDAIKRCLFAVASSLTEATWLINEPNCPVSILISIFRVNRDQLVSPWLSCCTCCRIEHLNMWQWYFYGLDVLSVTGHQCQSS